jgi:hypothetical protein
VSSKGVLDTMGRLFDRLFGGFRRAVKAEASPPRRSPWVLMAHLPSDPGLQCHFCGRAEGQELGSPDRQGEGEFALVQARHNPRLQHIVCGPCLQWNSITSA